MHCNNPVLWPKNSVDLFFFLSFLLFQSLNDASKHIHKSADKIARLGRIRYPI